MWLKPKKNETATFRAFVLCLLALVSALAQTPQKSEASQSDSQPSPLPKKATPRDTKKASVKKAGTLPNAKGSSSTRPATTIRKPDGTKTSAPTFYPIDFTKPAGIATLTNDSIIKMTHAGLSDVDILATMELRSRRFMTTESDLSDLTRAGVSHKIIDEMVSVPRRDDQLTDSFAPLRELADRDRARYLEVDERNMAAINHLTGSQSCATARIELLVSQTIEAMRQWSTAEEYYWKAWDETQRQLLASQTTTIASAEANQKHLAEQLETERKRGDELQKVKASLAPTSVSTYQIATEVDALIRHTLETISQLTDAQREFQMLATQAAELQATYSMRSKSVEQNIERINAWNRGMTAHYAQIRAAADSMCKDRIPGDLKLPIGK